MKGKGGFLFPVVLLLIFLFVLYKMDDITEYTVKLIDATPKAQLDIPNVYSNDKDYLYVQKSKDFIPFSKQDIKNIFYSILDNGYDNFTFYCPSEYSDCISDVTEIMNDQTLITDIGNFVHPFNNFHDLHLTTSSTGEVNLQINRNYTRDQIDSILKKVDEIFNEIFTEDMDLKDKILKAHDYIIDNTSYAVDGSDDLNAYNLFFEGKSKCSGYADAMAIILYKLDVKNYKIGSAEHVWNAVYLDDTWSHIDVTWDDPIVEGNGTITNTIRHKFYLIDTETLLSYDTNEHNFDKLVYRELK